MKNKKITSSLVLAGIVLSGVCPVVTNAESASLQNQTSSNAVTHEISKGPMIMSSKLSQSGLQLISTITQTSEGDTSVKENTVNISTFQELKAAFASTSPMTVHLTNNIAMTQFLDGKDVKNPNLTIDGSDGNGGRYTLDFGEYYIDSIGTPNCHLTIQNLNTVGGSKAWGFGAISYNTGGTITARNVSHKGIEFLLASDGITLGGDVNIEVSKDAPTSNAISVWGTATNLAQSNLTVEDGAEVNIKQSGVGPYWGTVYLENASSFIVGNNATFNVELNATSLIGDTAVIAAPTNRHLAMDIKSGAKVQASTNTSRVPAFKGFLTTLNIEKGATFNATSYDQPALRLLGASTNIALSGAFDFDTQKGNTSPIESHAHTTTLNFNDIPVKVWNLQNLSEVPTKSFGVISGIVNILGSNATQVNTNDSIFNSEFSPNMYHRISSNEKQNTVPVINAEDKIIHVGDIFDPMVGVTATDAEDGDLTSEIEVTSNNVDTTKVGTYQVAYSVTDSDGNVTERTIRITVQ